MAAYSRFPAPIDHVYILCDPVKEPDRAKYLLSWLTEHNIDPAQYTLGLDCYGDSPYFQSRDVWRHYDPWTTAHGRKPLNFNTANLKPTELSLIWNFAGAARRAVQAGHKVVAIFESDVIFFDDFLDRFAEAMAALPTEAAGGWDFLSLSASAAITPYNPPPTQLWHPPNRRDHPTRCTDSMVFRVPVLKSILTTLFPCAEPLDWELNFQLTLHGAKALWLHPPIMRQGSGLTAEHTYPTRI
jgi:hypothetical protein